MPADRAPAGADRGETDDDASGAASPDGGVPAQGAAAEAGERRSPAAYPDPPGPRGYPVVGNTLDLIRDPFDFLEELSTYGDLARYRAAGKTFTGVFHPEHVQQVLVEEPERYERFLFADRGTGFAEEGLLFVEGEAWQRQRRTMEPAFTVDRIRSYGDVMTTYTETATAAWDDGQTVAVNREFAGLTLRVLARALFDVEVDPDGEDEPISRAAQAINRRNDAATVSSWLPDWVPTPTNLRYKRTMGDYREHVDDLIAERRQAGGAGRDGPVELEGEDLLTLLLEARDERTEHGDDDRGGLSEAEVRDNLLTFLFAGHETTSLALTYAVLLLAQHDTVADRVRSELETVLDGDRPGAMDAPRLEYLDRVVREVLRLYPPAYIFFREATEPAVLGGYRIPAGSVLSIPSIELHRDERFYDDPEAFDPDRWSEERADDRPDHAYVPFGSGPRHCIGMRFAMLELKLVLATVVQQFDVTLVSDPEPERTAGATLQPAEDVLVRVHRRDG